MELVMPVMCPISLQTLPCDAEPFYVQCCDDPRTASYPSYKDHGQEGAMPSYANMIELYDWYLPSKHHESPACLRSKLLAQKCCKLVCANRARQDMV